jgi:hypothetical protein
MPPVTAPRKRANWQDAYDTQMALWRWYRAGAGIDWLQHSYGHEVEGLQDDTRRMLAQLYSGEAIRLVDCDPIYVSAEMCEVVDAAKDSFAPESLLDTDLVTPRGFVCFERPFSVPDRFERPASIAAVSWTRMFVGEKEDGAVKDALDRFQHSAASGQGAAEAEDAVIAAGGEPHGVALTVYATAPADAPAGTPPVVPFHLTPWFFGMAFDGNEWDENMNPTGAEWWWRIVQSTFRLMQQRIASRHFERPDRPARRDAAKSGFPADREVVVVRLRRERHEAADPTGEEAGYSHRFIVSGHWRNQWYPSIQGNRQIWISPYVKGSDQLPLIVRPRRVFQWQR